MKLQANSRTKTQQLSATAIAIYLSSHSISGLRISLLKSSYLLFTEKQSRLSVRLIVNPYRSLYLLVAGQSLSWGIMKAKRSRWNINVRQFASCSLADASASESFTLRLRVISETRCLVSPYIACRQHHRLRGDWCRCWNGHNNIWWAIRAPIGVFNLWVFI